MCRAADSGLWVLRRALLRALEVALARAGVRALVMPALAPPDAGAPGLGPVSVQGLQAAGRGAAPLAPSAAAAAAADPGPGHAGAGDPGPAAGPLASPGPCWWGLGQGYRLARPHELAALATLPLLQFPGTPLLIKALPAPGDAQSCNPKQTPDACAGQG